MFEKEADEMAVNNAKKIYGSEGSVCMNIQECAYVNGFQDGAEFGYNKANEWHYPSKGELPKEDTAKKETRELEKQIKLEELKNIQLENKIREMELEK